MILRIIVLRQILINIESLIILWVKYSDNSFNSLYSIGIKQIYLLLFTLIYSGVPLIAILLH